MCFPVNFAKFLRRLVLQNICEQLLLNMFSLPLFTEFKMAGFWGQNRVFGASGRDENNLAHYCSRKSYDMIIIDALTVFFDDQNASKFVYLDSWN